MNKEKYHKLQSRYSKKVFLQDDLAKQYVLYFNQETPKEIMHLIGLYATHRVSMSGSQPVEVPITIGGKVYKVIQAPIYYTLNLYKFYQHGLSRGRDWLLLTRAEYEEIAPRLRKKKIKLKRKKNGQF